VTATASGIGWYHPELQQKVMLLHNLVAYF
jgi:hypothetical protein